MSQNILSPLSIASVKYFGRRDTEGSNKSLVVLVTFVAIIKHHDQRQQEKKRGVYCVLWLHSSRTRYGVKMASADRSRKLSGHIFHHNEEAVSLGLKSSKPIPATHVLQHGGTSQKTYVLCKQHHHLRTECSHPRAHGERFSSKASHS